MTELNNTTLIYSNLDKEVQAIATKFEKADLKDAAVLNDLTAQLRRVGSQYSERDLIKGFVLELNGFDCSKPVTWQSHILEAPKLAIRMSVLGVEPDAPQTVVVTAEIAPKAELVVPQLPTKKNELAQEAK